MTKYAIKLEHKVGSYGYVLKTANKQGDFCIATNDAPDLQTLAAARQFYHEKCQKYGFPASNSYILGPSGGKHSV